MSKLLRLLSFLLLIFPSIKAIKRSLYSQACYYIYAIVFNTVSCLLKLVLNLCLERI